MGECLNGMKQWWNEDGEEDRQADHEADDREQLKEGSQCPDGTAQKIFVVRCFIDQESKQD